MYSTHLLPSPQRTSLIVAGDFDEETVALLGILGRTNWDVRWATTCAGLPAMLRQSLVPVIVSTGDLADGNWRTLLEQCVALPAPPLLIVGASVADEAQWAEALNLGAHDVLAKPFDRAEVVHVVSSAALAWHRIRGARERAA